MQPPAFWSAEPTARIEPVDFVSHFLRQRGLEASALGLRQTIILPLIPGLERRLWRALGSPPAQQCTIQHQSLYHPAHYPFAMIASPMGAPMAVMLLEQLIALGARTCLYLGFCGALASTYRIGDCFLPHQARREEGTSYHYLPAEVVPCASPQVQECLRTQAALQQVPVREGPIWTTDAPYRETAEKIRSFQQDGVHAVDMEMAALFAVGHYRQCAVGALLLVSDECYHPTWKPGFHAPRLRQACDTAVAVAIATATQLAMRDA